MAAERRSVQEEAQYTVTYARSPWKNCLFAWGCYSIIVAACRSLTDPCCILVSFTPSGADAVTLQAVHLIATPTMPPKHPPWADEDDSSPTTNASESFAPAPTRHPSVASFGVFLRAFLDGLADAAVSRASMQCIQKVLQQHSQASALVPGSFGRHQPEPCYESAPCVIAYLAAVHNNWISQTQRAVWLHTLRVESFVDFHYPILWSVFFLIYSCLARK